MLAQLITTAATDEGASPGLFGVILMAIFVFAFLVLAGLAIRRVSYAIRRRRAGRRRVHLAPGTQPPAAL